jgi:hypothetical protein
MLAGTIVVLVVAVLMVYSPSGVGLIPRHCTRPPPTFLETERQAVLTARRIWECINPEITYATVKPMDDEAWAREFEATLRDQVWHVSQIVPFGYAGGGVNFGLAQQDGHLMDVYITQ